MQLAANARLVAAGLGGTFAGSLHAVTGPDHLAALLPLCIGLRWWTAVYTGAYWGMGHGIGAALVGALAFWCRGFFNLDALCMFMEAAVGISIMVIGINGIREAREWEDAVDPDVFEGGGQLAEASAEGQVQVRAQSVASTLVTGVFHGCSGSGHLLGVMPALAMPSWAFAATYLCAFGFGTMLAMSIFTAVVGEASVQMGQRLNQPDVPAKLSLITSIFALVIGSVWTTRACVLLGIPRRGLSALLAFAAAR